MSHAVESFLNVNEVVKMVALMMQAFLNDDAENKDLFHRAPPALNPACFLLAVHRPYVSID
ncbi:hypothetical protein DPMN_177008 [Dreissena polymorpha]|uniref:Uncharacterized protein n=1 Tax=Dreissena polymorpha TaxID=45954 RepID=A0A9D4E7Z1_DREPO|nr:hypothetical protein DPMN_177008 [Dreissena polymorpha]